MKAAAALLLVLVTACTRACPVPIAPPPPPPPEPPHAQAPAPVNNLVDDYNRTATKVIPSIAKSAASPDHVAAVRKADVAAFSAVRAAQKHASPTTIARAHQAVSHLKDVVNAKPAEAIP